ncbi:nucleoside triphosphate pyrophosphatase [Pseudokineococcus marinus]|uniref:Nucleoside triphosphate pyrophosphatase n=1 Tax=Pseudokineococcus marinus TaxID=351215 RepID=A0A849BJF7_9ACTN|nr:Maf family nucleotide pyrophosphatase [Pseudokineococcus marinus]NNH23369.1 septum formation inhibitor Maf [Pseudokineococcus marinus]
MRLVLASASPARLALLRSAGTDPLVLVSGVDEPAVVERYGVTDAEDVCLVLARAKAEDVAGRLDELDVAEDEPLLVVGCDSVLELDGDVHGKPADAAEAAARWRRMRGRSGVLHTGHWLVDAREDGGTGATLGAVSSTTVRFADVDDAEVEAYVATGEPLRVAGAFTLDGLGGPYVAGVEGEPSAVVGLGLATLRGMLGEVGVRWSDLRPPADA